MSDTPWKPTRTSAGKSDDDQRTMVVELALASPDVRKTLEETIQADRSFYLKQSTDTMNPQLFILEIDDDAEKTFSIVKTVLMTSSETEVFLTSTKSDSATLLDALRAGMKEFLPQPLQLEEVKAALERFKVRHSEVMQESKKQVGKIITIFGGKGGAGTTTAAVNLAASIHHSSRNPSVALVDVNQHGGDIPLYLDLPLTHSFRDIAADLSRVDLAFLMSVLTKHESGLHVLPSGYDDLSAGRLNPDCVEPTLKLLQSMYEYVVIDCGHVLDLTTKKALEMSSEILVVSTLLVPAVHRTRRILELLRGSGVAQEKIQLLISRYQAQEKDVLTETEDILKHKANWLLPNDYYSASQAINSGKPVVLLAPKSPLTKTYRKLAESFLGGNQVPKSSSFWSSWLPSMKRKSTEPSAAPA